MMHQFRFREGTRTPCFVRREVSAKVAGVGHNWVAFTLPQVSTRGIYGANDGSAAWTPVSHEADLDGVLGPWLWINPCLPGVKERGEAQLLSVHTSLSFSVSP